MLTPLNVTQLSEQLINKTSYEAYTLIAEKFVILPMVLAILIPLFFALIFTVVRSEYKPVNMNWWLIVVVSFSIGGMFILFYYIFPFFFTWLRLNFS